MGIEFLGATYKTKVWEQEALNLYVAVDTETSMVENLKFQVPELATFQFYQGGDTVYFVRPSDIKRFLHEARHSHLIFQNISFDWFVIDKHTKTHFAMHEFLEKNQLHDTQILARLLHLAEQGWVLNNGQTSLKKLILETFGEDIEKGAERVGFGQFVGYEPANIPQNYLDYAGKDAIVTYYLFFNQQERVQKTGSNSNLTENIQIAGSIGLSQMIRNGVGFDLEERAAYLEGAKERMKPLEGCLANYGLVRGLPGFNTTYAGIIDSLGLTLPKTADGSYSSSEEDLRPYRDKFSFIDAYLSYMEEEKALSFVKKLNNPIIHANYDLLKNTGRTGSSSPNMQNLPRKGGIREMFKPVKEGNVFIDIDYSSVELATFAQICYTNYGYSKMRDVINKGLCPHYNTASNVFNKPIKDITKEERQFSKIPNFGFLANMAPDTFIDYAAGFGITDMDSKRATEVKNIWCKTYPETKEFFKVPFGANASWTLTGRKRADCSYTAYLNTQFQGLAADGAKIAAYYLAYNKFRTCIFVHDQFVMECEPEAAESVSKAASKIMFDSMSIVCPDVNIDGEAQIIKRFCK